MPYLVTMQLNQLNMLHHAPALVACEACGQPQNKWDGVGDLFTKPQGGPHLSQTHDGYVIASPKFLRRYLLEGWHGLNFRRLSNGYDAVTAERRVRMKTVNLFNREPGCDSRFEGNRFADHSAIEDHATVLHHFEHCGTCGRFGATLGGGSLVVAKGEIAIGPKEFVMTDFERAGAPLLLAGDAIRAAHKADKIRGAGISEPARHESWTATGAVAGGSPTGQIVAFPKIKRAPPQPRRRGSIRNPLLPDDL